MIEINRNKKARHTEIEKALSPLIGEQIRQARRQKGLTVSDIARKLGIDRVAYYRMEQGRTPFTAARLIILANWLGTTPHDLIGWKIDN